MMISNVYREVVMAYMCEISPNQRVYVDSQGRNTIVTLMTGGPGHQQQASNSFQTGDWVSPPEIFTVPLGAVIKLHTTQGEHYVQIQGGSMTLGSASSVAASQQMQMHQADTPVAPSMTPMQPLKPMQPMKMGNMEMNNSPMEMRMGNMHMRMGHMRMGEPIQPTQSTRATPPEQSASPTRKFCSQCGVAVEASDRFCSSCGHRLG
jgi:zinc-ribbon domain